MSGETQFVMTSKFDNDHRGLSSSPSTTAPRNNRSAWLSPSSSTVSMKFFVTTISVVLLVAGAVVSVPFILARFKHSSAPRTALYHNYIQNSTGNCQ